jgi:hypothetical protein
MLRGREKGVYYWRLAAENRTRKKPTLPICKTRTKLNTCNSAEPVIPHLPHPHRLIAQVK